MNKGDISPSTDCNNILRSIKGKRRTRKLTLSKNFRQEFLTTKKLVKITHWGISVDLQA